MKKAEEGFDGLVVNKNQKVELRNFHLRFDFLVLWLQKYRKSPIMPKIGQINIFFCVKMYNNPFENAIFCISLKNSAFPKSLFLKKYYPQGKFELDRV